MKHLWMTDDVAKGFNRPLERVAPKAEPVNQDEYRPIPGRPGWAVNGRGQMSKQGEIPASAPNPWFYGIKGLPIISPLPAEKNGPGETYVAFVRPGGADAVRNALMGADCESNPWDKYLGEYEGDVGFDPAQPGPDPSFVTFVHSDLAIRLSDELEAMTDPMEPPERLVDMEMGVLDAGFRFVQSPLVGYAEGARTCANHDAALSGIKEQARSGIGFESLKEAVAANPGIERFGYRHRRWWPGLDYGVST